MKKIFLAFTLLGIGTAAFLAARQPTSRLEREANAAREAWLSETQLLTAAQSDRAGIGERIGNLKQALSQTATVGSENTVWSELQKNGVKELAPDLRERLLEELGFNWKSAEDFIVVSKQALRDTQMEAILGKGKLAEVAAKVLALTPAEREQVEAATSHAKSEFADWAVAHIERGEPKDDILADYTMPTAPAMVISNNFARALFEAVGKDRATFILDSSRNWIRHPALLGNTVSMIIRRYQVGNEPRLMVRTKWSAPVSWGESLLENSEFPEAFRPIFPNGWADVAKREGFDLSGGVQEK